MNERVFFLLMDQNVTGSICQKGQEAVAKQFSDSLSEATGIGKFRFVITPFQFLEALGCNKFPKFVASTTEDRSPEDIFSDAKSHFSALKELGYEKLKAAAEKGKAHRSQIGQQIFNQSVLIPLTHPRLVEAIYTTLAFDALYSLDSKTSQNQLLVQSLFDVHITIGAGYQVSFYRAAWRWWVFHTKELQRRLGAGYDAIQKDIRIDNRTEKKDLLDTEIIYYSVMGYLEDDVLHPVTVCVAGEPERRIRNRIAFLKAFLQRLETFADSIGSEFRWPRKAPVGGKVIVLEPRTMKLVSIIVVDDVPPLEVLAGTLA